MRIEAAGRLLIVPLRFFLTQRRKAAKVKKASVQDELPYRLPYFASLRSLREKMIPHSPSSEIVACDVMVVFHVKRPCGYARRGGGAAEVDADTGGLETITLAFRGSG